MFEITAADVAQLNDEDLRSLVALLCEAEMRIRGLPVSSVTWGGNQNAADGGIDVRVSLPAEIAIDGFVPRPQVGFQVKKPDMTPATIGPEMCPQGVLRPSIRDLIDKHGAYIIVSSGANTSDTSLQDRRAAMAQAVTKIRRRAELLLDFYDRVRVASWVRSHAGMILWVRNRVGRSLTGWRPYEAWANPSEDVSAEYLLDDTALIRTGKRGDGQGISGLDGIDRVRLLLREARKVVRLVGLSGVGKTRFVQALFDARIGTDALNPALALYTNLGDNPDPQPIGMVSDLIGQRLRAIVVIDNCPPDLHRRLSELCRAPASLVSVITVEYDIRDDTPEATEVIRIEPSSIPLIEQLLKRRFPRLSVVDASTIAIFAGGNARVAIALANTVGANETISGFGDEALFQRLFDQRHGPSEPLMLAGQACSLVYSFEGETLDGEGAELPILADLIGVAPEQIFRAIAELRRRDLVQQRGVWRAVLPHAIANRLAALALQNIPMSIVEAHLVNGSSTRLLRSFSRRLGYLDTSAEAVALVKRWFAKDGLLADVTNLNELGETVLRNVAPVVPEAVLGAFERASPEKLVGRVDFAKLLRSLAWDPVLFDRSTEVLAATADADSDQRSQAASCFESLFFLILSGTHADVAQRLAVVDAQIRSDSVRRKALGLDALRAMLEAWHFSSGASFEFGARSRDYGYLPRTTADYHAWFAPVLKAAEAYAVSTEPFALAVRTILGKKFRGLWTKAAMYDDLERVCSSIHKVGFWREGWIGVKETLRFDSGGMNAEAKARLETLEALLRPVDLVQKVRSMILGGAGSRFEMEDIDGDDGHRAANLVQRRETLAIALGCEAAKDPVAFRSLLPELTSGDGLLWKFGMGLALGVDDPDAMWSALTGQFATTDENARNSLVLSGFLEGLNTRDPTHVNRLLDDALADEALGAHFPSLQRSIPIDQRGAARLMQALDKAAAWQFKVLAWGRASEPMAGSALRALVRGIAAKPEGFWVAAEIVDMRLFTDKDKTNGRDPDVVSAGRDLLEIVDLRELGRNVGHHVGCLIGRCLKGADGVATAQHMCRRFMQAIAANEIYAYGYDELIGKLFKVQPVTMLDGLFGGTAAERKTGLKIIEDLVHGDQPNPLDGVGKTEMLAWCEQDPAERYPMMASVVTLFRQGIENTGLELSEIAQALLDRAPHRLVVVNEYVQRFRPHNYSGSLAAAMEVALAPLRHLEDDAEAAVAAFAKAEGIRLRQEIEKVRQRETESDRQTDERFE